MNWLNLKERFPNSYIEIREHFFKTGIINSRILIEDFLRSKGYEIGFGFINNLKDYEIKKSQ
jgi:hypothetical protein